MRALFIGLIVSINLHAGCLDSQYKIAVQAAHDTITHDLYNGQITSGHPFGGHGNQHEVIKIKYRDPESGRNRDGVFKPRPWGDSAGWARVPGEYVAYYINRKLGMDYIAPTAYRRGMTIDGKYHHEGAMIHFIEGKLEYLLDTPESQWGKSKTAVLSDNRVLTVLLQNPDSIHNNLLFGKHWVDGKPRPIFMDWSASLHPGLNVTMTNYPYFRNELPVYHVREQTLNYLKKLHWDDLQSLREFMSKDEMRALLSRRDGIVAYFERLIEERGYDNVVLKE